MNKNIVKTYLFSFSWMFLVIIPVLVPYFQSLGLTMHEVFQVQAIFGIVMLVMDVPTGYLCDLWGRKKILVLGSLTSALGFTLLIFVKNYWGLALQEVILGLGASLVSGADISILYDSLENKTERIHGTKALSNMHFFQLTGEAIASILGGYLVIYSFRHAIIANAVAGWIPFFIALSFSEPNYIKMKKNEHWKNFKKVLQNIFHTGQLQRLIFLNLLTWSLSTFFAVWILQKYWSDHSVSIKYFGLLWASFHIIAAIAGKQAHNLEKRIGILPVLLLIGLLPIISYLGMAYFSGFIGVAFGGFFYITRGFNNVLLKDAFNWRLPSEFRATANSIQSFFFRAAFAVLGPLIGYGIDKNGLNNTLKIIGFAFLTLFILILLPLLKHHKKLAHNYIEI